MNTQAEYPMDITGMGSGRRNYEACHLRDDNIRFGMLHSHDFFELYINVRGGRHYVLDDQTLSLTGNDLIIVRPFQIHGHLGTEPLRDYERLFIYITREVIDELSHNILPLNQLLDSAWSEQRFFCHISDAQLRRATDYIDAIYNNCLHETPYTRLHDTALLTQLLLLVLECVETNPDNPAKQEEKPPLIQQILNYINENYDQRLSLDSIASNFFISKSHLSHMFVQYTSRSLYDYILYCRVNKAKQLITDGTALTSISYQCGFSDYSNFLRSFTRTVGCSPSGYKKRLQAGAGLTFMRERAEGAGQIS